MKFILETTDYYRNGFLEHYKEELADFKVATEERIVPTWYGKNYTRKVVTVELDTLEELNKLCEKVDYPIIFDRDSIREDGMPTLEIYDGYRE